MTETIVTHQIRKLDSGLWRVDRQEIKSGIVVRVKGMDVPATGIAKAVLGLAA